MPESTKRRDSPPTTTTTSGPLTFLFFFVVLPVGAALLLYWLDSFDPVHLPIHELTGPVLTAPARNSRLLHGSELIGVGALPAPEDLAFDSKEGVIYTGCADGWGKRVTVNESVSDSVIENWVNTGGRPLGLVLGNDNQVVVADSEKGLLSISKEGVVELLSDEAEGVKFKLTNCPDVAKDGMIYFTDSSSKYNLKDHIWDILEGNPHGRLMSYDPSTKETEVLVRDLYLANGVVISPDQSSLIYCESVMRRCRKYHLQGEKKGSVEEFVKLLPGLPDNIRYDGEGLYWIALAFEAATSWDLVQRYPFLRKILGILERYVGRPHMEKNGGVFAVDLEGKPVAHYYDASLSFISSGIKIGKHLYLGSAISPYIIRLNLEKYPALPSST
ncbi:hypothetical protein UlMin_039652 [Ulmus minor]